MSHYYSLYEHVLFSQSRLHRGLLVVPLTVSGGEYSFAIVEPGAWDAVDSDRRSDPSLEACLAAGVERIELYLSQLPGYLVEVLDKADCSSGGGRLTAV